MGAFVPLNSPRKRFFERANFVQARSTSKGIAAPARELQCVTVERIVPRFENLNSLAGASGLYFIDKRPLEVINGATSKLTGRVNIAADG